MENYSFFNGVKVSAEFGEKLHERLSIYNKQNKCDIYINGVLASQQDLADLEKFLNNGRVTAKAKAKGRKIFFETFGG